MDDDFVIKNKVKMILREDGQVKFATVCASLNGKEVFAEVWYSAPGQKVYTAANASAALIEAVNLLKAKFYT